MPSAHIGPIQARDTGVSVDLSYQWSVSPAVVAELLSACTLQLHFFGTFNPVWVSRSTAYARVLLEWCMGSHQDPKHPFYRLLSPARVLRPGGFATTWVSVQIIQQVVQYLGHALAVAPPLRRQSLQYGGLAALVHDGTDGQQSPDSTQRTQVS